VALGFRVSFAAVGVITLVSALIFRRIDAPASVAAPASAVPAGSARR
jgi:hypothetical protein